MQPNPLADLSIQQLKRVIAIRENIEGLERELDRVIGGKSSPPRNKRKGRGSSRAKFSAAMKATWATEKIRKGASVKPRLVGNARDARKPSRSGPLKQRIIRRLKAAGNSGVTVKDLAAKLGTGYSNISVWFHTTAKKVKEIKKVAPGRFAWTVSSDR